MAENGHIQWETEVAENRLCQRHILSLAGKTARNKKRAWVRPIAEELKQEIGRWHYKKQLEPPDIEVAWIVHSQIAWKGPGATGETLWEDLPETDPVRIMEAEREGPETDCPVPQETILLLKKVLSELEEFGHDIKNMAFSENWEPGAKKDAKTKGGVKKPKWGYKKKEPLAGKALCKSRLLSDFFELKK